MAPSNFVVTNPEVLRATLESRGANLLHGLNHLLEDLARGEGRLAIRMTDLEAFEVGGEPGAKRGKVIYQNDLMQLLQYAPSTEQVYQRPLRSSRLGSTSTTFSTCGRRTASSSTRSTRVSPCS